MHALINPDLCVGCTKCLKVCGYAAITGQRKQIHVVKEDACTACGDCLPVCPIAGCIVWSGEGDVAAGGPVAELPKPSFELPSTLLAQIAAAREATRARYEAKGPLNTPKELRPRKG